MLIWKGDREPTFDPRAAKEKEKWFYLVERYSLQWRDTAKGLGLKVHVMEAFLLKPGTQVHVDLKMERGTEGGGGITSIQGHCGRDSLVPRLTISDEKSHVRGHRWIQSRI